jgi:hypothetical protein
VTVYPKPPAHIEPYVRVFGYEGALSFLEALGGAELALAVNPNARSKLVEVVGFDRAQALAEEDARVGLPRRVPLGKSWVAQMLWAKGLSKAEIARRMRTSDVTVRKYLRQVSDHASDDTRQLRLF